VTIYVGYLRRRLNPAAPREVPILTRRGIGYEYSTRSLRKRGRYARR
jgi:DNA-binding response OmpR family regulator